VINDWAFPACHRRSGAALWIDVVYVPRDAKSVVSKTIFQADNPGPAAAAILKSSLN